MDTKIFLASKTVWGVVLIALPQILPLLGFSFTADDTSLLTTAGDQVFQAIGAVIVVWGRWSASTKLSITGK